MVLLTAIFYTCYLHRAVKILLMLQEHSNEFQVFLVVDKTIICEIQQFVDIPFILMASFFVFNICYRKGCTNLYSFMEIVTLNYPPSGASASVKHFLSSLSNIA